MRVEVDHIAQTRLRRAHYLNTPTVPRVAQQRRALMKRGRRDHGRLLGRGRQQITECRLARVRGLEDHVRRHGEQALMQLTTKSIHDRQYGDERRNTQQHPQKGGERDKPSKAALAATEREANNQIPGERHRARSRFRRARARSRFV